MTVGRGCGGHRPGTPARDFRTGIEDRAKHLFKRFSAASTTVTAMKLSLATLFVTGAAAFQAPSQSARSPIALEATRSEVAAAILGASALFAPSVAFAARCRVPNHR